MDYIQVSQGLKAKKDGNKLILEFDTANDNFKLSSTGKRELIGSGGKVNCLGFELNAMLMRLPQTV